MYAVMASLETTVTIVSDDIVMYTIRTDYHDIMIQFQYEYSRNSF